MLPCTNHSTDDQWRQAVKRQRLAEAEAQAAADAARAAQPPAPFPATLQGFHDAIRADKAEARVEREACQTVEWDGPPDELLPPSLFPRHGGASGIDVGSVELQRENPWGLEAVSKRKRARKRLAEAQRTRPRSRGARGDTASLVRQLAAQRRLGQEPAAQHAQSSEWTAEWAWPMGKRVPAQELRGRALLAEAEVLLEEAATAERKGFSTAAEMLRCEAAAKQRAGMAALPCPRDQRSPQERAAAIERCGACAVALDENGDVVVGAGGVPRARVRECGARGCSECERRVSRRHRRQVADALVAAQRKTEALPVVDGAEVFLRLPSRSTPRKRLAALRRLDAADALALLQHAEAQRQGVMRRWRAAVTRRQARGVRGPTRVEFEHGGQLRQADADLQDARVAASRAGIVRLRDLMFVTLTQPALEGERCLDALERMATTLRRFTRTPEWRDHVAGGVLRIEVERNEESGHWHVHAHALVLSGWWPQAVLASTWQRVQRTLGVELSAAFLQDIQRPRSPLSALSETLKYVLKPTSLDDMTDDAARELLHAWSGRRMVRTFGSLRGVELTEEDDEAIRDEGTDGDLERAQMAGWSSTTGQLVPLASVTWVEDVALQERRRVMLAELWERTRGVDDDDPIQNDLLAAERLRWSCVAGELNV